ncbi:hypothetical protein M0804_011011 [Polistes exclamans]|nr:hypothetical protein M0804_011011 [Polistes exclamans]
MSNRITNHKPEITVRCGLVKRLLGIVQVMGIMRMIEVEVVGVGRILSHKLMCNVYPCTNTNVIIKNDTIDKNFNGASETEQLR